MDDYRLIGIPSKDVPKYWELVLPFLFDAQEINDDTFSIEGIFEELVKCESQLWIVAEDHEIKAVGITKVMKRNDKYRLFFNCCAGENIENWLHLMHDIVNFAKQKNCQEIKFTGRRGWKKALSEYGYQEQATIFNLAVH